MPSVTVGHQQVAGEHGHDKNQQADVAAQAQCRGKEYEQQRQNAADEHPYQAFVFHIRRYFLAINRLFNRGQLNQVGLTRCLRTGFKTCFLSFYNRRRSAAEIRTGK
jgi:hypothetical protein